MTCSAIFNNSKRTKPRVFICQRCGNESERKKGSHHPRKFCHTCLASRYYKIADLRKCDVTKREIYNHSSLIMKKEPKVCVKCGFKHAEICHIKPVHKFSDSSLISEINARDNLIMLCPNCHWKLDHNLDI